VRTSALAIVLGPMADNGSLHVEEADRINLERPPSRLVALQIWQPRGAVPLQTAMERRARQPRDRGLEGMEAIIERQQRVAADGHDHGLLLERQPCGVRLRGTHRFVGDRLALAPFLHRRRADPGSRIL
jgi:hypothetical protein